MWLKNLWNLMLGRGKMDITRRVLRFFLFVSAITLLLSSILALGGIFTTEDKMRAMGEELGSSTRENVTNWISEREKEHLTQLVHEKVGTMDTIFKRIAANTKRLSENAEDILSEQENYSPKDLIRSKSMEDGWSLALMLTPSTVNNLDNLRGKIAMAANIQNNLKNTALSYVINCSVYAVFEEGFGFIVDTGKDDMRVDYFENPNPYLEFNFLERPWYKNPKEKNNVVFSDTMLNMGTTDNEPIVVCSAPINVNGEFIGVTGIGFFVKDVAEVYLNRSIDESGFCFLMNDSGQVIVSQKSSGDLAVKDGFPDLRASSEQSLASAADKMSRGEKGLMLVTVDGEEYILAFEPLKSVDWRFGALIKISEITAPADAVALSIDRQTEDFISRTESFSLKLLPIMAVAFVILLAAVLILSKRVTKSIVKPIHELSDGVREISSGNLDKKIDIHTGDEIEHLATCFNAMTYELKIYMANLAKETAENERISTELNVATNIQQSMLPHDFPRHANFEIYATMNAAKEVGGDFYDFYLLDENHLVITIADVSGKGVPAALFMAISKTILQNFALSMQTPDDFSAVMTLANQQLCKNNDEMLFVTVFMGMLDLKTGEFIYVNAGHNAPLVCRKNKFEYLDVGKSCMLGIDEDVPFPQKKINLAAGDMIFLYTDGVTEAMNTAGELFGENYLRKVLNGENKSESLEILLENLRKAIKIHAGDAEQSDDITMLALKWNGGEKNDG